MQLPDGWKVLSVEPTDGALKVTISVPSDTILADIASWENEGGFALSVEPVEVRPMLPYTQEDTDSMISALDTHTWLYSAHRVTCTMCHVSKGSPDALAPCRWAS